MRVPIISSTHWDREWRFSFQQTRAMLVDLMDNLIDILDSNPEFKYYHLDAQTVVIDDYLEIRPEKREALKRLVGEGRILVGPWYTLPDMCSIGGEPIIRNLLIGHKKAKEFGKVMKVGYTPTGFGQIAQLPQIYAGFGVDTILFYRGVDRDVVGKEFLWEAPDGTKAVTYVFTPEFGRMPLFYCVASNYYRGREFYDRNCEWEAGEGPFRLDDNRSWKDLYYQACPKEVADPALLEKNIKQLVEVEMKKSCMDTFLLLDGVDSTEPQPLLLKLIEDMNRAAEDVCFYHASIEDFAVELKKAVHKMPVYRGEMRASARYGKQVNLMGSAISSRIYLKQLNNKTEKALIAWAEPFSSFSWTLGADYPAKLFELAWKYLLWNQSHDAIAGCSQDIVHQDMEYYFRQSREISDVLTSKALFNIASNISGEGLKEHTVILIVFNPLPYERSEVVRANIDIPCDSAGSCICITDTDGKEMELQVEAEPQNHQVLVHRPKDVPGIYRMKRWNINFLAEDIPALGYRAFIAEAGKYKAYGKDYSKESTDSLENEYISVKVDIDGLLEMTDLRTGRKFKGLNRFEDDGEAGDPWIRKAPDNDVVIIGPSSNPKITIEKGELSSSITIAFTMSVPEEGSPDGRSTSMVPMEIESVATLKRGEPWLSFRTVVKNNAKDHRLRVLFPTGIKTDFSLAEAPFEIMKRDIRDRDTSGWFEQGYTTYPQRGFAAASDGIHGLAVLNRGLPEYELIDDDERTMAISLLRCYKMYVPKLKTIDQKQLGSQCLGEHVFEYAVCPLASDSQIEIKKMSDIYNLPLKTAQSGRQTGQLPLQMSFLNVTSPLVISAVKKAENRDTLVVRLFNPSQEKTEGELSFYRPLDSAYILDMEEERLEKCEIYAPSTVRLQLGAKKILTLELEL